MLEIRSKEELLKEYVRRYPELDKHFEMELGKEYDRYKELLKDARTKEEALEVFQDEIRRNEETYKSDELIRCLEGSPHDQYMEILANYGLIVFFRDNMLV